MPDWSKVFSALHTQLSVQFRRPRSKADFSGLFPAHDRTWTVHGPNGLNASVNLLMAPLMFLMNRRAVLMARLTLLAGTSAILMFLMAEVGGQFEARTVAEARTK